jgi:hypothetical protein
MHRILLAAILFDVTVGCGSAPVSQEPFARRNRAVLAFDEIQAAKGAGWSAYDVIAQLRPEYLRSRGASSVRDPEPPTATVYLDGVRFGNLQTLKSLSGEQIQHIEYINAADATTRFGTDHAGGAIMIRTR